MYKTIVAWQVRKAFARLNAGDPDAVVERLAPDAVYEFAGEHALGGRRQGPELIRQWFARLSRIFPGGQFDVNDVLVKGWPWRTRVVTIVDVSATVADEPYVNRMIQVLDMRWMTITGIYTLEDTQLLAAALQRAAAHGVEEAVAAPIEG